MSDEQIVQAILGGEVTFWLIDASNHLQAVAYILAGLLMLAILVVWLAARFPDLSRTRIRALVDAGTHRGLLDAYGRVFGATIPAPIWRAWCAWSRRASASPRPRTCPP